MLRKPLNTSQHYSLIVTLTSAEWRLAVTSHPTSASCNNNTITTTTFTPTFPSFTPPRYIYPLPSRGAQARDCNQTSARWSHDTHAAFPFPSRARPRIPSYVMLLFCADLKAFDSPETTMEYLLICESHSCIPHHHAGLLEKSDPISSRQSCNCSPKTSSLFLTKPESTTNFLQRGPFGAGKKSEWYKNKHSTSFPFSRTKKT